MQQPRAASATAERGRSQQQGRGSGCSPLPCPQKQQEPWAASAQRGPRGWPWAGCKALGAVCALPALCGPLPPPGITSRLSLPTLTKVVEEEDGCRAARCQAHSCRILEALGSKQPLLALLWISLFPLIDGKGGRVCKVRSTAAAPQGHRAPAPHHAILFLLAVCLGSMRDPSRSPLVWCPGGSNPKQPAQTSR